MKERVLDSRLPRSGLLITGVPYIALATGLLLTFGLWLLVERYEDDVTRGHIESEAQRRSTAIQQELTTAQTALQRVASFFRASSEVTREEFAQFVAPILEEHPEIRGLGYNPLVRQQDRAQHEALAQLEGLADYHIWEQGPDGKPITAPPRPRYFPAYYLEPLFQNEGIFGFDVHSEQARAEALTRACELEAFASTGPISLVQDEQKECGFLAFYPYHEATPSNEEELEGVFVGVYLFSRIVEGAMGNYSANEMVTEVRDGSSGEDSIPMYVESGAQTAQGFDFEFPLEFGGQDWLLVLKPTVSFREGFRSWSPRLMLISGIGLSILGTLALALLIRYSRKVEHLVRIYRQALMLRQEAEDRLRKKEEHLTLTLSAMSDGAWDWDIERDQFTFTPSWLQSLGYDPEEVGSTIQAWETLLHPDDVERVREERQLNLDGENEVFESENRLRTKSGEYRHNQSRGKVVNRDANGAPLRMVGVDIDITQRKREELEHAAILGKIQQSQKLESLGVVVGGIAHDFNNLLVGILGSAELAREELPQNKSLEQHLTRIETAGRRAAELTREMLAYAGRGTFEVSDIDLCELVDEMPQLLSASLSKKAVFEQEMDRDGVWVHADPAQLRQVIMNLLINASDALGEVSGQIVIRTGVRAASRSYLERCLLGDQCEPGPYAFIEVQDTGCGMSPDVMDHVFDPFFTTKEAGRGLGLAAVIGIVCWHSGAIHLSSSQGVGTTIRVLLPAQREHQVNRVDSEVEQRRSEWSHSGKVLLADDEAGVRQVASRALKMRGFEVIESRDGRECLELFHEQADSLCLVILDVSMPHISGIEVAQQMRSLRPDLPIVISSGYTRPEDLESVPGVHFLAKPFNLATLIEVIQSAIEEGPEAPSLANSIREPRPGSDRPSAL